MSYTKAEENYLKAIFHLSDNGAIDVSTNALAEELKTKASSVTDMVKKLSKKKLLKYKKYKGAKLTKLGNEVAISIIRKHRLWEFFLVEKLKFKWDQVHEIAEQLEHINSDELTNRLDNYLDNPKFDPHGDPIPDVNGELPKREKSFRLSKMEEGSKGVIVGVNDSEKEFLQYLEELQLTLGAKIEVKKEFTFDKSKVVVVNNNQHTLSFEASKNILVKLN